MSMRELLIINPNTSSQVSALLQAHAQTAAGAHVRVRTATARFGAPYIADEASFAVAAHAGIDAWAAELAGPEKQPDAVLIGCFGDPGLMALRESSPVPVTGLAEASFIEAARHGRYAIVTGGQRWGPMLQRLAQSLGQAQQLAGIHTVVPTGAQLAADPVAAQRLLAQACCDAVHQLGAVQAVILGGAGLAGMAAAVQANVPVPVIDSVTAGVHWALRTHPTPPVRRSAGFDIAWAGLSSEMQALAPDGP
jgi:Asp/Glu/hydantoin racemase